MTTFQRRALHAVTGPCLSLAVVLLVWLAPATSAFARDAAPLADDPALEARVMAVAEELRCLVCQNETIAASQADLAVDLRKQIRTQLAQGRTDTQILDHMVSRYGEFVRYRPAFNATTVLLWAGPFVLLGAAGLAWRRQTRRRGADAPAELSEAEARRLEQVLAARPDGAGGAA